jgi:hypothetical protein
VKQNTKQEKWFVVSNINSNIKKNTTKESFYEQNEII